MSRTADDLSFCRHQCRTLICVFVFPAIIDSSLFQHIITKYRRTYRAISAIFVLFRDTEFIDMHAYTQSSYTNFTC